MKIEELLFGTRTRNAEEMGGYYAHWEAQLYCAVITMVLRNLDVYIQLLDGKQVHHGFFYVSTGCGDWSRNRPCLTFSYMVRPLL